MIRRRLKGPALALIAQITATAAISLLAIRAAGAGTASVAVQAAAFLIGAVALWAASRTARPGRGSRLISAAAILVVAVLMLTTGVEMQGAHRWLSLGPVLIHPASLLGAPLLWLVAQDADDVWTAGVAALTILTFGLSFDGAASLAFAVGTTGLLTAARGSWKTLAPLAALSWILALWSLTRSEALPRVPYVEDVVPTVWAVAPVLGGGDGSDPAVSPVALGGMARARLPSLRRTGHGRVLDRSVGGQSAGRLSGAGGGLWRFARDRMACRDRTGYGVCTTHEVSVTAISDQPTAGRFEGRDHLLPVRVYYEDTDFTGLVYHANYVRYFERGRSDFLRAIGVGHADLLEEAEPLAFVVSELNIKYLKPARIDDALVVRTVYEQVKGVRLIIRQSVERAGEVLCRAEVTAVCIHLDGRPRRPSKGLVEKVTPWLAAGGTAD